MGLAELVIQHNGVYVLHQLTEVAGEKEGDKDYEPLNNSPQIFHW